MREASNFAEGIDKAFYFIMGIDLFFLIGLSTLIVVFIIKYSRKRHPKAVQIKEKMWLEVTWFVIPLIIVIAMFIYGYWQYSPLENIPKNGVKITVVGKMWTWNFKYENGKESDKLVVPLNKPVILKLESVDVIHSLFIPAFRIKKDLVPGRNDNYMWFIPTIKDTFDISCTAYCGVRHSYMLSNVIVLDEVDYNKWLTKVDKKSDGKSMPGYLLLDKNACTGCHSIDGSKIVGPSFKGLFGTDRVVITDGKERTVKADEAYIKTSILEPEKDVVKGFDKGLMQSYKGVLKDEEINQIIEYFKAEKK